MIKDIDLIAVGYPSLDRIIKLDETPSIGRTSIIQNTDNSKIYYGGCNVNIAYLGSKLGLNTLPMMRVGCDFEASGFKKFLKDAGIGFEGIQEIENEVTSNTYLIENEDGHHITLFYPGAMDSSYETIIDKNIIKRSKYGVITVGNTQYNIKFLKVCKEEKIPVIFGMKCDFKAFPLVTLKEFLFNSEIIFTNEGEQKEIEKCLELSSIKELMKNGSAKCLVVTKGTKGSEVIYLNNKSIVSKHINIARAEKVVDSTGVGDAYMTGFIYGLVKGKTYEEAGRIGSVVSSFIIEAMGCLTNIPTLEQIENRYMTNYGEEL